MTARVAVRLDCTPASTATLEIMNERSTGRDYRAAAGSPGLILKVIPNGGLFHAIARTPLPACPVLGHIRCVSGP